MCSTTPPQAAVAESAKALWMRLETARVPPLPTDVLQLASCAYGLQPSDLDRFDKLAITPYLLEVASRLPTEARETLVCSAADYFFGQMANKRRAHEISAPDAVQDLVALTFANPTPKGLLTLYQSLNAEPRFCRAVYAAFRRHLAGIKAKAKDISWTTESREDLVRIGRAILDEVYNGPLSSVTEQDDDDTVNDTATGHLAGLFSFVSGYQTSRRLDPSTTYLLNSRHSNYARKLALLEYVAIAHELQLNLSPPRRPGLWQMLFGGSQDRTPPQHPTGK